MFYCLNKYKQQSTVARVPKTSLSALTVCDGGGDSLSTAKSVDGAVTRQSSTRPLSKEVPLKKRTIDTSQNELKLKSTDDRRKLFCRCCNLKFANEKVRVDGICVRHCYHLYL